MWLAPGSGTVTINDRDADKYLGRRVLSQMVHQPFEVTETQGRFDVIAHCKGGGISGQAGAIRHGISKALLEVDPELRPRLRRTGLLTRDPRVKERKKYGRKTRPSRLPVLQTLNSTSNSIFGQDFQDFQD